MIGKKSTRAELERIGHQQASQARLPPSFSNVAALHAADHAPEGASRTASGRRALQI